MVKDVIVRLKSVPVRDGDTMMIYIEAEDISVMLTATQLDRAKLADLIFGNLRKLEMPGKVRHID